MIAAVLIIFLSFAGFLLAYYIWHKKSRKEQMVCPLKAKCDPVIHSEYAKFFGISIEVLGLLYYGGIGLGYGAFLIFPMLQENYFAYALLALSGGAAVFSVYLTFIQVFALRAYCSWCLASAAITLLIFLLSLSGVSSEIIPFLGAHRETIVILHVFSMAIGLGAATMTDFLFFKFLKDLRINAGESEVLRWISQVIWFALGLVIVTGLGLYLPEVARLSASPKFLLKMVIIGVIIINGSLLNLLIAPKLVNISFHRKHAHAAGELHHLRRLAFVLGPISLISWYSAFLLGSLRSIPYTFIEGLGIYLGIILLGVFIGQIVERFLTKPKM